MSHLMEKHSDTASFDQGFEALFRKNPFAMTVIKKDTKELIDANEAFLHWMQRTHEEIMGKSFAQLTMLTDTEEKQLFLQLQNKEKEHPLCLGIKNRQGHVYAVQCFFQELTLNNAVYWLQIWQAQTDATHPPAILGVLDAGVSFEPTKQLRGAQRDSKKHPAVLTQNTRGLRDTGEEFLFTVLDSINVGMAIISPDTRWMAVNQKMCTLFGYTKEAFTSISWKQITHPFELVSTLELIQWMAAHEIIEFEAEKRFVRKDGSVFLANFSLAGIWNKDGSVKHFIVSMQDISADKDYETELENRKAEMDVLFKVCQTANFNLPIRQGLEKIQDAIVQWLEPDAMQCYLMDQALGAARLPRGFGLGEEFIRSIEALVLQVMQEKKTLVLRREDIVSHAFDSEITGEGLQSLILLPISLGHRSYGTLCIAYRKHRLFHPNQVKILQKITDFMGLMLKNEV